MLEGASDSIAERFPAVTESCLNGSRARPPARLDEQAVRRAHTRSARRSARIAPFLAKSSLLFVLPCQTLAVLNHPQLSQHSTQQAHLPPSSRQGLIKTGSVVRRDLPGAVRSGRQLASIPRFSRRSRIHSSIHQASHARSASSSQPTRRTPALTQNLQPSTASEPRPQALPVALVAERPAGISPLGAFGNIQRNFVISTRGASSVAPRLGFPAPVEEKPTVSPTTRLRSLTSGRFPKFRKLFCCRLFESFFCKTV